MTNSDTKKELTFAEDVALISKHFDAIVLENAENAKIVVSKELQARTMTSTANGDDGNSYGYINYDILSGKQDDPQINLNGGEDRLWVTPEGSQFSIFFDPGVEMEFKNWRTPKEFDSVPWEVAEQTNDSVLFSKSMSLQNMARFTFDCRIDRKVTLLSRHAISEMLDCSIEGLAAVAHECQNQLTNTGTTEWSRSNGLIGLWTLCMNKPSAGAVMIVPFKKGSLAELGPIVNADYFGKLDTTRLAVDEELGIITLRGDGDFRSKLGLTFSRAQPRLGSWNPELGLLTVVDFNLPSSAPDGYTNNLWSYQENPFNGDVINAYNDGPNESGGKLGGFYELETCSPALALEPQQSFTHVVRTFRIEGDREKIDTVAQKVLGVSLKQIESQLKPLT